MNLLYYMILPLYVPIVSKNTSILYMVCIFLWLYLKLEKSGITSSSIDRSVHREDEMKATYQRAA